MTQANNLLEWLATIEPWPEEFPEIADPPPALVELAVLWGDDQGWPFAAPGPAVDDRREVIYEPDRGA